MRGPVIPTEGVFVANVMINMAVVWSDQHGAVRSAASSYAAMRMVAGSRPVVVIA